MRIWRYDKKLLKIFLLTFVSFNYQFLGLGTHTWYPYVHYRKENLKFLRSLPVFSKLLRVSVEDFADFSCILHSYEIFLKILDLVTGAGVCCDTSVKAVDALDDKS